jgi:hypothetical protein
VRKPQELKDPSGNLDTVREDRLEPIVNDIQRDLGVEEEILAILIANLRSDKV